MTINNLAVLTTDGELLTVNTLYLQLPYDKVINIFFYFVSYIWKNLDFLFFVFIVVVSNVERWSRKPLEHLWKSHRLRARQNLALETKLNLCYNIYFIQLMIFEFSSPSCFRQKIYHVCRNGYKTVNAEEKWLYN